MQLFKVELYLFAINLKEIRLLPIQEAIAPRTNIVIKTITVLVGVISIG